MHISDSHSTPLNGDMITPLVLSMISGFSTAIGGTIVIFLGKPKDSTIGNLLGFAAGVMLFLSFFHLLPEVAEANGWSSAVISFIVGAVFVFIIESFVPDIEPSVIFSTETEDQSQSQPQPQPSTQPPSKQDTKGTLKRRAAAAAATTTPATTDSSETKGLSEKTTHAQQSEQQKQMKREQHRRKLLTTGLMVMLAMSIHNFPEGMAVYMSCMKDWTLGVSVALSIGIHNIPEGMCVACPIYAATQSKWEAFKWSLLSGLCEPLGAIVFAVFFQNLISNYVIYFMLGAVGGVMIYICAKELLPTTFQFVSIKAALASITSGLVVAYSLEFIH